MLLVCVSVVLACSQPITGVVIQVFSTGILVIFGYLKRVFVMILVLCCGGKKVIF